MRRDVIQEMLAQWSQALKIEWRGGVAEHTR